MTSVLELRVKFMNFIWASPIFIALDCNTINCQSLNTADYLTGYFPKD